jgi:hypothetical protein
MISNKTIRRFTLAAALIVPAALFPAAQAHAGVFIGVSVGFAPPPLPVYVQPALPAPGYLWTPGYWAYGDAGYYWVPGVWVEPPSVGLLWTPGYWGYAGGAYGFHGGYWGPHVGFYGGVNYGFGYGGIGFFGGEWRGGAFAYNGAVANFGGVHVSNVYVNRTVIQQNTIINNNHVAYNGGPNGINRQPTPEQQRFSGEQHVQPTANQTQHQQLASQDRSQLASVNHGRPATTAVSNNAGARQTAQSHPISAADRTTGAAYHPNAREANQDQRIANGERSGQITSGEAARSTANQSRIDSQVSADRAANGGKLTGQEQQQVNREQNNASRQISNQDHNGNSIAPNEVNQREANQQQRTAQGLRSGQETSAEAGRTNANQSAADQQVHNQRTANGGALTQQQRQQANQQENHNSRQINNQKHNAATHAAPPKQAHPAPRENQGRK